VWFLDVPEVPDGTFDNEFALVFGGTVSAGAYTAGAIDFLIEALDCLRSTDGWKGSQTQYVLKAGTQCSRHGHPFTCSRGRRRRWEGIFNREGRGARRGDFIGIERISLKRIRLDS
jgi:hypothetical protein